jgi:FkbH-like protein
MAREGRNKTIKCVVWDLDHTLWNGVLAEESVTLKAEAPQVVETLDGRGILQSVASHNDHEPAMAQLESFGLADYFLVPQINWGPKSASVQAIAERLNVGLDTFAFVDDQPYEREEVGFAHPEVLRLDGATALMNLLDLPRMTPSVVTEDSRRRRLMYGEDFARRAEEESFEGPAEAFLATLDMRLGIAPAAEQDLRRAEELTERTHQLNSTGTTYSYDELDRLRRSPEYLLLVADLEDRFGPYGRIGLALVERRPECWLLKLLIVSCRVMTRGVGAVLLQDLMRRARDAGVRLQAEFRDTGRNRVMNVTYRFAGFRPVEETGDVVILEHDLRRIPPLPDYLTLRSVDDELGAGDAAASA